MLKSDDPVEQAKQVKCMDLVANVIMLHNVHDLTGILADMEAEGWKLTRELLAGLSPSMREHIRRFGRFLLDMDDVPPPLALQPLPPERRLLKFAHILIRPIQRRHGMLLLRRKMDEKLED